MKPKSAIVHYGIAILLVLAALLVTYETMFRTTNPLFFFVVAVILAAWFGGLGPGLVASVLSVMVLALLVFPPLFSFAIQNTLDQQQLIVFAIIAPLLSILGYLRWRREWSVQNDARLQTALAEISQSALATHDLGAFLHESTRRVCDALAVDYCALGEFAPESDALVFQAGTGWGQELVGQVIATAGPESFADLMLTATEPVVIKNLRAEKRFRVPAFLTDYQVSSGVAVTVGSGGQPFGMLSVFARRAKTFSPRQIEFLRATAAMLAVTIEHHQSERVIREHRNLLLTTLLAIHDAVIATDVAGAVVFMNPAAELLTGWTLGEALGNRLPLNISDAETFEPVEDPIAVVLRDHTTVTRDTPSVLIPKSGRAIPIDYTCAPIRNQDDQLNGAVLLLRDASARLRTEQSIFRLAAIVNASEDAVFSQTLEGIVLTWNPGAERLLGYTASEIVDKSIASVFPTDYLEEYRMWMQRLRHGEPIEQQDTICLRKDGERIHVSLSLSPIRDAAGRIIGASAIARDITGRKRAEAIQRFLAEASELLAASLDPQVTLVRVAQLAVPSIADWCAIHLCADGDALELVAYAHSDPAKRDKVRELFERFPPSPKKLIGIANVIATGEPEFSYQVANDQLASLATNIEHLKLLVQVGVGAYIIVPLIARERTMGALALFRATPRYAPDDLALAQDLARRIALAIENARLYREAQELSQELEQRVIARTTELQNANVQLENQIAERKRVNEELRRLSAHLQSAREEERIRIAREIHDQVGQVLTAVKMDLALLDRKLTLTPRVPVAEIKTDVTATIQLVDKTIQTMREIIRELRPEILDHLGLSAAIEWQLQEFQARTGIACQFDTTLDEVDLDLDRSTAVFRIFQETLTNIARHAQATRIETELKQEEGTIVLRVCDNGKGFVPTELANKQTFGVLGMRERAHVFGGDVTLDSAPGQGTTVTVKIPV